jgi:hypothetical protein
MKSVKKTAEYEILQKRSGRYAVRNPSKKWVNGDDKAKILAAEGLIKLPEPKKEEPAAEEGGEASAE